MLDVVDVLVTFLSTLLAVIVSIGLMNTLWLAIRERTPEIGTLRAIGMQRRAVAALFLIEALLLGLFGSSAGAAIGLGTGYLIAALRIPASDGFRTLLGMGETLDFAVEPMALVKAVAAITLTTTLVSLFPSLLAARLKPVTAIHDLG
jgi:ABC-type antimicrobial peptide transport system permease subunit